VEEYIDKKRLRRVVILGVMLILAYLSFFFGNQYLASKKAERPVPSHSTTATPSVKATSNIMPIPPR
jgi:hypothetical protein